MTLYCLTYRNQNALVRWLLFSTPLIKVHNEHKKQSRIWLTWPLPGLYFIIPMRFQVLSWGILFYTVWFLYGFHCYPGRYFNYSNLKKAPEILKGSFKMCFEIFSPSFQTILTQILIYCIQTNHGQENPLRTNEVKCFLFLLIVKTFPIHYIFNLESNARTITFLILKSSHVLYSKVSFC